MENVPLINEKSAALQHYHIIMLHHIMQHYMELRKNKNKTSNLSGGAAEAAESRSQNQSQKSGSQNHCQGQSQSQRKPGDVRQDVRHPRNPRVIITMSETAGSSAELRLRRRAQGGCAVEGKLRAISNRATTTMRHESATTATTTMRLLHADRRSRGMCCEGRIEERRTESRIGRLQRVDGSVGRPLRGPL